MFLSVHRVLGLIYSDAVVFKRRAATEGRPYSTFRGAVRSEGQYVPKACTFRVEFNTFQDDLLILQLVEQGGDAGAEEEAVDEAPEEHAGAAADGIVDC